MKINEKDIFVLKTRSLIGVYYVSIDSVRGIIFIILLQTQWEIFFFPTCKPSVKQTFVSFLVFVSTDASSSAKIASFETVAKGDATLKPIQKQWNAKGTNRKLLSTD